MPCNCGNKNSKMTYIYTDPQGRQSTHDNNIAAKAAQIRAGGGGNIRTVPK